MEKLQLDRVSFRLSLRQLSDVVMSVPLLAVLACFVSAYVTHDDINHTRCQVYNFLPSISAITGVSPQRYLWRLGMSVHLLPRWLLARVWHTHQQRLLRSVVPPPQRGRYRRLADAAYWLSVGELVSLAGVTYVSNKENYPVHEKLFSLFLLTHSAYMLSVLAAERLAHPHMTAGQLLSARLKLLTCTLYTLLIVGLLYYFWKHRFFCQELAFTWFCFCEYGLCVCIMLFHLLVSRDQPDFWLTVGCLLPPDGAASANGAPPAKAE